MDEVIEFDTGPYRNRKVVKPDSSPGGLGWFSLPAPKRPSEMTPAPRPTPPGRSVDLDDPTLVWVPLLEIARELGVPRHLFYNRTKMDQMLWREGRTQPTNVQGGRSRRIVEILRVDAEKLAKTYLRQKAAQHAAAAV